MSAREANRFGFYETLHGPLVEATCEACLAPTYESVMRQVPGAVKDPPYTLCGECGRRLWGLT
jgi:hypothetical protein